MQNHSDLRPPRQNGRPAIEARERAICGTLIEGGPDLPPNLAELVRFAPASFEDPKLGELVAAIRRLREAGQPVSPLRLNEILGDQSALLLAALPDDAIPTAAAEIEAAVLLDAFRVRQTRQTLLEAAQALETQPNAAQAVRTGVCDALADLDREGRVTMGAWDDFATLSAEQVRTPPALVDGLIRLGEKVVLGGASKSFKSWAALDLALCVATGSEWLGRRTRRGRVLVVNLELPRWCVRHRLLDIAHARGVLIEPGWLTVWTLRGFRVSAEQLRGEIRARTKGLALVVVDPVYRLLQGRDENAAGDIGELLASLGGICADTEASLVAPAHFAKGNAAAKEAMDRISGSGVFARDPDTLLTLTRHETEGAYALEAVLRTFPPAEPVVVRWTYPVFTPDQTLDPTALRKPAPARGRPPRCTDAELVALLPAEGITKPQWQRLALHTFGLSQTPFYGAARRLEAAGLVCVQAGVCHRAVQGAQEGAVPEIPEFPKTLSGNPEVPSVSSFPEITVGDQEKGKGGQRKRKRKKGRR